MSTCIAEIMQKCRNLPLGTLFELLLESNYFKTLNKTDMTMVKVNNNISKTFDGFLNDLFNDFPASLGKSVREDVFHFPPVNIVEKAEAYVLEVAAPGLEKTDFAVKLDGKLLTISAEKKTEATVETDKVIRQEFGRKAFKRSFTLDDKIEVSGINARYENGILFVSLPKKEEVKQSPKDITIG
jgi:HSP20 family protein